MGNWYQTKQASTLVLLVIALIFASCSSYRKASFYPMINSVDHKKSGFQIKSIHKSYQKNLKIEYTTVDLSSTPRLTTLKTGIDSNLTLLERIPLVNNVTNNRFPMSLNNQETISASLSTVPIIARYNFIPDTSITHDSLAIDSTQIKITQIQSTSDSVSFHSNAKKLKQRETFANISLGAAITSIVSLFVFPYLFFPAVIAAIVFGALGLKSSKRKRARNSIFIGIIMIVLMTLFVLAYAGAFS